MFQPFFGATGILVASLIAGAGFAQPPGQTEQLRVEDTIIVKSGGTLAGQLRADEYKDPESGKIMVALETPSGGQIMLEKSRVARVGIKTDLKDRDYENRIHAMEDTPEAHWEIANLLKADPVGRTRYRPQLDFHYRRIIELDPNDILARRAMGFTEVDGHWYDETGFYASQGYIRDKGKWRSKLELDLIRQEDNFKYAVREAGAELHRFKLRLSGMTPQQAAAELKRIAKPEMVEFLFEEAKKETNLPMKLLLVDVIGTQQTLKAGNSLIWLSVMDPSPEVRDRAISLMLQNGYDLGGLANNLAAGFLSNSDNQIVNRAANVIGQLGGKNVVLELIQHIVTSHTPPANSDPGRLNAGQNNSGGGGLSLGSPPPQGPQPFNNPEVVNALRILTGVDYRYSKPEWMKWYIDNFTISGYDLHRDQ